jgi:AraC family transcriptional regulator, regulatory protein of adaptative response / methylated-DNA-[protein]-cysteine methyltransferase
MNLMTRPIMLPDDQNRSDYEIVRRTVELLTEHWREQPGLDEISAHVGTDPARLHKLFSRWCGLTPKAFLQAITLDHARALLRDSATVLDATYEVGLSGPGRLHDLFVIHEAMTPGEFRSGGAGLEIAWGFHESPFGDALIMTTARGLAGLAFADRPADRRAVFEEMAGRWPHAGYREDEAGTASYARRIFDPSMWRPEQPLRVVLIGSDFELRVWESVLRIPVGRATTYGDIAGHLGKHGAARAVGAAVGRNPVCFVVPCHRVLGRTGELTGYHWGLTRKRAILGWEAGLTGSMSA